MTGRIDSKKEAEILNCVDPDEVADYKPPHQDLCCLPSREYDKARMKHFCFANFVVCFFGA